MVPENRPITDDEIEELREQMEKQRAEIRQALAENLGGDPGDYDAEAYFQDRADDTDDADEAVPDGG